jgi:hypothetical protein
LAFYYKDLRNRELTIEWLKNAAAADDYRDLDNMSFYGDLDNRRFLQDVTIDNKERAEKGIREMSSQKVRPQKKIAEHSAEKKTGGCFIATAVYGSPLVTEVAALSRFRDEVLLRSNIGRASVHVYYSISPPIASLINEREFLKVIIRSMIRPIIWAVRRRKQT